MRTHFDKQLSDLQDEILRMGSMVEEGLRMALGALAESDHETARRVLAFDATINAQRFAIEDFCVELIARQQPIARDLRSIVAVMNMIVDLERMGDQAKGIANIALGLGPHPEWEGLDEIWQMGDIVIAMLDQCMKAYAAHDIKMAREAALRDNEVDELYLRLRRKVVQRCAETDNPALVQSYFDVMRATGYLERYGDQATNVAERVIYIFTGAVDEINPEPGETL